VFPVAYCLFPVLLGAARKLILKGLEEYYFLLFPVKNNNVWKTNLTFSFFLQALLFSKKITF
jgi:hypothetical protein